MDWLTFVFGPGWWPLNIGWHQYLFLVVVCFVIEVVRGEGWV